MLKILILEDEKKQLDKLTSYLSMYQEENTSFEYSIESYEKGISFIDNYKRDADLIFLDIRLPDMFGIDVARKIREIDDEVMIIFVTNLTQYAVDGYSVNAFDYILKPLQYASFSAKLARALRTLSYRNSKVTINLKNKESGRRISADTVTYIESIGHDIYFHVGGETIKQWGTLGKYEAMLKGKGFIRCNASYLVNLKYVKTVKKEEVLIGNDFIPISRSRRKEFLTALAQYKGGSM